jgi:membrane protease YdiL (CAAX protease family)
VPAIIDVVFVFVLVVVASALEHWIFWPQFRKSVAEGARDARMKGYRRGIIGQWSFVLAMSAIWIRHDRSLTALRLTMPGGWRLAVSVVIVAVMIALMVRQLRAVQRLSDDRRAAVRPRLDAVAFLLPHTRAEHRLFLVLAATAGICEELLYRGYLTWFLTPWLGTPGAFAAVVALFGIGHAYQGRKGAIKATAAGAVMTLMVGVTGWLVPAMIVHALVDAGSGTLGYWVLREPHSNGDFPSEVKNAA